MPRKRRAIPIEQLRGRQGGFKDPESTNKSVEVRVVLKSQKSRVK
jgi:hypothetical protein